MMYYAYQCRKHYSKLNKKFCPNRDSPKSAILRNFFVLKIAQKEPIFPPWWNWAEMTDAQHN